MDQSQEIFVVETKELLADLESALLDMESDPSEMELVNRAFRAMHTIKGSGSMFGYVEMSRFTHHLEDTFDRIRKGEMAVTQQIINIGLRARDHLENLLEKDKEVPDEKTDELLNELNQVSELRNLLEKEQAARAPVAETTYRIKIQSDPDAFESLTDPRPLLRELQTLGECDITTITSRLPNSPEDFNPDILYLDWQVTLTTTAPRTEIEHIFIFVIDEWQVDISEIDIEGQQSAEPIGKILQEHAGVKAEDIEKALAERGKVGEYLVSKGVISKDHLDSALREQNIQKQRVEKSQAREQSETIKVQSHKLDKFMDMIGELVINQARLQQVSNVLEQDDLELVSESLERLTSDLRDAALEMRMLPMGASLARFRRLVRDVASELGKKIKFTTSGEDTELDKTLLDKLVDPMVHLLRNSLDHGIEMPEERREIGKPEEGTIHLSATHKESCVLIQISDDGRGIDSDKVLKKAIEKGLVTHPDSISKDAIPNLIFEPGFSTAESVSSISGRGVGMDAVKTAVEMMGGKISLHSKHGYGTRIDIELPLTLAIIDGLLVRIGTEFYVLPLSTIEQCIELENTGSATPVSGLVEVRGQLIPQVCLRQWFEIEGQAPEICQAVVARYHDKEISLIVDEVIGEHQTVIKNLGPTFRDIKGISGATILGTGGIALIIDIAALTDAVEQMSRQRTIH